MATPQQFAIDIAKFAELAKGNADKVVRKTWLDMCTRIIQRSPVDTGRFATNWQFGVNVRPEGTKRSFLPTGENKGIVWRGKKVWVPKGDAQANAIATLTAAVAGAKYGTVCYFVNNLPYGPRLEFDAWSKQAPAGMVGVTIVEFQQFVDNAVNELQKT